MQLWQLIAFEYHLAFENTNAMWKVATVRAEEYAAELTQSKKIWRGAMKLLYPRSGDTIVKFMFDSFIENRGMGKLATVCKQVLHIRWYAVKNKF